MPLDNAPDDTFTLEGMIAWLETQPPETEYHYGNISGDCLVGRYFKARGLKVEAVGATTWDSPGKIKQRIPPILNEVACRGDRIYSNALARARKLKGSAPCL